jgi:hypothetical protein
MAVETWDMAIEEIYTCKLIHSQRAFLLIILSLSNTRNNFKYILLSTHCSCGGGVPQEQSSCRYPSTRRNWDTPSTHAQNVLQPQDNLVPLTISTPRRQTPSGQRGGEVVVPGWESCSPRLICVMKYCSISSGRVG